MDNQSVILLKDDQRSARRAVSVSNGLSRQVETVSSSNALHREKRPFDYKFGQKTRLTPSNRSPNPQDYMASSMNPEKECVYFIGSRSSENFDEKEVVRSVPVW